MRFRCSLRSVPYSRVKAIHGFFPATWRDSSAIPGHTKIDKLWRDRRIIQDLVPSMTRYTEL